MKKEVIARIYVKGSKRYLTVHEESLAEKAVRAAMLEFNLPRSYFYIMKGEELAEQEIAEEAYKMSKKIGLRGFMEDPAFKF